MTAWSFHLQLVTRRNAKFKRRQQHSGWSLRMSLSRSGFLFSFPVHLVFLSAPVTNVSSNTVRFSYIFWQISNRRTLGYNDILIARRDVFQPATCCLQTDFVVNLGDAPFALKHRVHVDECNGSVNRAWCRHGHPPLAANEKIRWSEVDVERRRFCSIIISYVVPFFTAKLLVYYSLSTFGSRVESQLRKPLLSCTIYSLRN